MYGHAWLWTHHLHGERVGLASCDQHAAPSQAGDQGGGQQGQVGGGHLTTQSGYRGYTEATQYSLTQHMDIMR